jgi:hypothetical protein
MDTTMGPPFDGQVTGEPRDTETVTRGSERGRWKSTHQGNSLASYPTARRALCGGGRVTGRPTAMAALKVARHG